MRKKFSILTGIWVIMVFFGPPTWASHTHRVGVGVHYWASLEDIIIDDVDEAGLAFLISYQYQMFKFFTFEADMEILGEGYAGATETVLAPQGYFLIGRGLYGGIGVGINFSDGDFAGSPFFALRTGIDLEIFPTTFLNIFYLELFFKLYKLTSCYKNIVTELNSIKLNVLIPII